eukprot:CAMPEP_0115594620 /NCGR_PEP_ID=MMETSP0272-20121206/11901_1 /TAXON_ID=71861 /ORGANISM="Scrippsiella trochoidea, Strain CCMP3099" /LENGTH=160 /DNA_ID=CAMNT_0003029907 /DNA_START=362 /DNA_END=844 /DNA_ORIENTATION=-
MMKIAALVENVFISSGWFSSPFTIGLPFGPPSWFKTARKVSPNCSSFHMTIMTADPAAVDDRAHAIAEVGRESIAVGQADDGADDESEAAQQVQQGADVALVPGAACEHLVLDALKQPSGSNMKEPIKNASFNVHDETSSGNDLMKSAASPTVNTNTPTK